jgi:hypothetical protein
MFERFSRSWQLVKASASVLSQDKELLVFPMVSAVATFVVGAAFVLPMIGMGAFDGLDRAAQGEGDVLLYVWAFLFYVAQYFVIFFFNAALVGAAMIRLQGGDPTVADGFRIAFGRIGALLGYALIAATVGMLLRMIQERAGMVGKFVSGLIGVAWTVASFLVVPILVTREVGPIDAVKESAQLLRRTWGENLIGQGGIGLVFGVIQVLLVVIGVVVMIGAVSTESVPVMVVAGIAVVGAIVLVALVQTALAGIYSAALYRHASGEGSNTGFEPGLLQSAFAPK